MRLEIGLRSDVIEARYSFEWLFDTMEELGVRYLELAGFPLMSEVRDGYFEHLRELARARRVRFGSVMTAHRELAGLLSGDRELERAAVAAFRRYVDIAALVGAPFAGASAGSIPRDRLQLKPHLLGVYVKIVQSLMRYARARGLRGLVIEPMSSLAEPPSTPEEIDRVMGRLAAYHRAHRATTVPVYTCADTSHALVGGDGRLLHDHLELFRSALPYACELHVRNTDRDYASAFGFSPEERQRGVVDLDEIAGILRSRGQRFLVGQLVAYLEIPGPRLGRDHEDGRLRGILVESVRALAELQRACSAAEAPATAPPGARRGAPRRAPAAPARSLPG